MQMRQVKYFLAVVECGSFSLAAVALNITQPSLSRTIRHLEQDLGTPLFQRHGRGVRTTEAGAQFRATIAPLIQRLEQAKSDLVTQSRVATGEVAVGLPPSLALALGPKLINSVVERFPGIRLTLLSAFSGYLTDWLLRGDLHLAVINMARQTPHLHAVRLMDAALFHIAPSALLNARQRSRVVVPLEEALNTTLILPSRRQRLRRQIETAANRCGVNVSLAAEVDSPDVLREFVRQQAGSTIMPYGAVLRDAANPAFVVRRIVEPPISARLMLSYPLGSALTPAVRELAGLLHGLVEEALAQGTIIASES